MFSTNCERSSHTTPTTFPARSRRSRRSGVSILSYPKWRASIRPSIMICRVSPRSSRSRGVTTRRGSVATVFTARTTPTSWRSWPGSAVRRQPEVESSLPTSVPGRALRRSAKADKRSRSGRRTPCGRRGVARGLRRGTIRVRQEAAGGGPDRRLPAPGRLGYRADRSIINANRFPSAPSWADRTSIRSRHRYARGNRGHDARACVISSRLAVRHRRRFSPACLLLLHGIVSVTDMRSVRSLPNESNGRGGFDSVLGAGSAGDRAV
jgi:hypothetical protein